MLKFRCNSDRVLHHEPEHSEHAANCGGTTDTERFSSAVLSARTVRSRIVQVQPTAGANRRARQGRPSDLHRQPQLHRTSQARHHARQVPAVKCNSLTGTRPSECWCASAPWRSTRTSAKQDPRKKWHCSVCTNDFLHHYTPAFRLHSLIGSLIFLQRKNHSSNGIA